MSSYSYSAGYRPDIAGLRALAVLSLVLFHAGVAGFSGGYVGIDVFFVVIGYLLTRHLLPSFDEQHFSFRQFYARRVWRVLPALTVVTIFSVMASAYFLMPEAFDETGVAAQRTGFFAVNYYFWGSGSDYWQQLALGTQPLLHLWSLAVGAQFVLLLPCLMAVLWRVGRRHSSESPPRWVVGGVLLGLVLVSLGISGALLQWDQAAAFYLLSSRLWEFLFGALIAALAGTKLSRPPLWLAEVASILGIMGVLWGVLTYTTDTPFPGEYALPPVLGAGLILYAMYSRIPTLVSRLLSLRPVVFVGVLSYSLFLWHWPLLVFFRSTVWEVAECARCWLSRYSVCDGLGLMEIRGTPLSVSVFRGR
jgi:peptidoglycan/LPS O-acetylase OafA/YrhL